MNKTEKNINAVLFGATGMVGKAVLLEALDSNHIKSITAITRRSTGVKHEKLNEIIHDNFEDYSSISHRLKGFDACFFCIGISSMGVDEEKYTKITYGFAIKAAEALIRANHNMKFCFVSAVGADSTENGKTMWARVKGKAENKLLSMPFSEVYVFRPGYIQPKKGVKSRVKMYNLLYNVFGMFYPLLKAAMPNTVTSSDKIGKAIINAAVFGFDKKIIHNREINELANIDS